MMLVLEISPKNIRNLNKREKNFDNRREKINFAVVKLSIIIPVYRVEDTLERCVQSVVSQTYSDFEIILVDDGSPDNCPQLCDAWAQRDSRISVIHKQNGGLSDARNAGLDAAKGEFITFVDSDDYLVADTYEEVMKLTDGADMVEFPFIKEKKDVADNGQQSSIIHQLDREYHDMSSYWLNGYAYEHCYAWNKIYRRELFDKVRFPKGQVFEDVSTLPLLLRNVNCLKISDKGLYYYTYNDRGITATASGIELLLLLQAHLRILSQWTDERYYMHVLNIQLDVCRMTGVQPDLKRRWVSPFAKGLTTSQRLKTIFVNTLGVKALCRINKIIRRR